MQKSDQDADYVPMPIVLIDQDSNSDATIVQLSFGDCLGALIDTVKWLLATYAVHSLKKHMYRTKYIMNFCIFVHGHPLEVLTIL